MDQRPIQTRMRVAAGFASDIGKRADNQDFAAVCLEDTRTHHGVVAALADGVGGYKGGRVAAELAVRSFIDDYLSQSDVLSPQRTAGRALESINYWINRLGNKDENLKGMSCAFTGVVLKGRRLHSFHVGDTRLYRLREGVLTLLTQDHKPEGQEHSPYITRAVGAEDTIRIDYRVNDLIPHDRLLLCSDGMHSFVPMEMISDILDERASPEETAQRLVRYALDHSGDDNTTAMVLDVLELPAATVDDLVASIAKLPLIEPPEVGDIIDGFKLEHMLADGVYSRVFRARDLKEARMVLMKFPKPHTIGSELSARQAFMRETWVASRVQHIWIGAVLTLPPKRQTCLYIVQPFYEGETLEKRLSRAPKIALEEGVDIAIKMAKALGSLHRAGIIHRDIKPENIILLPGGGLKLIDLGVARLPQLAGAEEFHIPGTPSYMAPEQLDGKPGDERSDIFALGVTLYRMFTGGDYPFGEIDPSARPKFKQPEPLSTKRRDLPAWLESLIFQALAPDPNERFQDGFEMAFKLETGAYGAAPNFRRNNSWVARNPIRLWQMVSLGLLVAVLVLIGVVILELR